MRRGLNVAPAGGPAGATSWQDAPYLLIDADVVDVHALREHAAAIRVAGPAATHGNIEDQEERMVEHPVAIALHLGPRHAVELHPIDEPPYARGIPLDRVHVVIGIDPLVEVVRAGEGRVAGVVWAVHCAMRDVGLETHVFHDVELA